MQKDIIDFDRLMGLLGFENYDDLKDGPQIPQPEGGVAHAEFRIGNTRIYISDESAEFHAVAMPEGTMASCLFFINVFCLF